MKKLSSIFIIIAVLFVNSPLSHAAISMSVDGIIIDFRITDPGQSKELYDKAGDYHTEVTCTSNNNRTWYLKAKIVTPLRSGPNTIPMQNFKWKVTSVISGQGTVNNINQFNEFSAVPVVIYTSDPADETGNQVKIRLRYGLTVPKNQITGTYNCILRFIMMETL